MLSAEANDELTRVGPGTPMGELLRRYWHPVGVVDELRDRPTKPVRLLGEDLVLFRNAAGRLGLIAERCPHRGASLAYGFPDGEGLRCPYHGWLFAREGTCLEQPNQREDSPRFRAECAVRAYRVEELGGLVFAYLGPEPAPLLPRYDLFVREADALSVRDIGVATVGCNWLQIMENSFDPTHVEWLHGHLYNYWLVQSGEEPSELSGHHVRMAFDRFEHGIIKRRLREGQSEDHDDWRVGHPVVFPNILRVGGSGLSSFQIRVPIDDVSTRHYWYCWYDLEPEDESAVAAVADRPRSYEVPLLAEDGSFLVDTIDAQDAMVWVTQGAISDRTSEHLCQGDRGVVLYRKLLQEQCDLVAAGHDPIAVVRDPDRNRVIDLPQEHKPAGMGGDSRNYLATFLRTQAKHSPTVQELVRRVDERLTRTLLESGAGPDGKQS